MNEEKITHEAEEFPVIEEGVEITAETLAELTNGGGDED